MAPSLLEVRELRTHFFARRGLVKAVDGVSFELRPGETLALVGESGSGKSITALSILRLVPPPGRIVGGEVLFEGQDLLRLEAKALVPIRGAQIGIVFQDPLSALSPFLTIERQLTEGQQAHRALTRADARARARAMLSELGLADAALRLEQFPHQLSGGMRQRVLLAMALLLEPKLLIVDEPTSALDATLGAQLLRLLREQTQTSGTAVLLIAHDLGVVAGLADRVAVMYAGRIVEQGLAEDLFERPLHPYTQGLLACAPRKLPSGDRLRPIPGMPPDPMHLPSGCPFHPRCERAMERCQSELPSLDPMGPNRSAACWALDREGEA